MNVKIAKEVKRSDSLWRFACADVFEPYVELPQLYGEIKIQNKELWKEKQELGPEWEDSLKENLMWNSINTNMLLVYTFRKYS